MLYLLPSDSFTPFPHWEKLVTYLQLWRLGCPVLKSAILTEQKDLDHLDRVICHLGNTFCTLRFQYVEPCSSPIRGGNIAAISKEGLEDLWSEDRILWLMEPANRLTNLFGVNIAYIPYEERIVFEIVGRGFDVSDINRGDVSPHQIIKVNHPDRRGYYGEIWKGAFVSIVSEEEYLRSVLRRKTKLERMGFDTARVQFAPCFKPIYLSLLETLDGYAQKVFGLYNYAQDVTISCTVLEGGKIIFWDIQTPEGKYAALYKAKNN